MVYLEYRKNTGYVVKIHADMPNNISSGNDIIETNDFNVGDEVKYYIEVGLEPVYERDENGDLVLVDGNPVVLDKVPNGVVSAIQQAPAASYILEQLAQKENDIIQLKQKLVNAESDNLNIMLALTELYEMMLGGV